LRIDRLVFSRDGKRLASSGSSAYRLTVWDPARGKPVWSLERHLDDDPVVAFLGDGATLLYYDQRAVHVVDTATGEEYRTFPLEVIGEDLEMRALDNLGCLAVSPDGSLLLTREYSVISKSEYKGVIRLWDISQGKALRELEAFSHVVNDITFSPDNEVYAWLDNQGNLGLGKVTGETLYRLTQAAPEGPRIHALTFSPDAKQPALGWADGTISILAVGSGRELRRFDAHGGWVTCLAYMPDGKALVSGGDDYCLRVWDAETGKEEVPTHTNRGAIQVALSPDGTRLATAGLKQRIHCWDVKTGNDLRALEPGGECVKRLVFPEDGKRLTALTEKTLRSWDLKTGRRLRSIRLPAAVDYDVLSPDGRFAGGPTGLTNLSVLGIKSMRRLWAVKSTKIVGLCAISPDSQWIGTWFSGEIHLWEITTGKEMAHFDGPPELTDFVITPDRELLLTISFGNEKGDRFPVVDRCTVATGTALPPFEGDFGNPYVGIVALAVSPDGKTLVTADGEGAAHLWEVASGQPRGVLTGHQGEVNSLAFSGDGRRLATGSRDTTALLWDLTALATADKPLPAELNAKDLDALWVDLRSGDAAAAYRAIALFAAYPKASVPYLRPRLDAVAAEPERLARLIADLDSDTFQTRQKASAELADLAEVAEPALREALKNPPSAEVRRRAEDLLEKAKTTPYDLRGERLRTWRALEALEMCATPEACEVLGTLARGDGKARLTHEAKLALDRLRKRGVKAF
jgi:WD40 repeat protein